MFATKRPVRPQIAPLFRAFICSKIGLMVHTTQTIADDLPLAPRDTDGKFLAAGNRVRILSVASCVKGLPIQDQERLIALVGQTRALAKFDGFGFAWLPFDDVQGADFCLFPTEVSLET